jgi:hypothetical protein
MAVVSFRPVGANNIDPPESVGRPDPKSRSLIYTEGTAMVNIDPYEQGGGRRRRGAVMDMAGTNPHSGWSNGREAYFIEACALKRFWPGAGSEILALLSSDEPGAFCQVNNLIVMSNGVDFHVIEGGRIAPQFVPTDPFKVRMSPGNILEFYNGRLYAALGNVLYCSDSLDTQGGIEQMDERQNVVAVFASEITLVKRVIGGLFVSDGQETFFFGGQDPMLGDGFSQNCVLPYPAIPGTALTITGKQLGSDDIQGEVAMWASTKGACVGLPGGSVVNLSAEAFAPQVGRRGAAIIREENGQVHYLCVMRDPKTAHNAHNTRILSTISHPIAE